MMNDKELRAALLDKIEELDWSYSVDDDGSLDIRKYSPAGEDYGFYIEGKDIAAEVREYYEDFDPEEHAAMWIENRHTTRGVPDIKTLIRDADAIDEMLKELAEALSETERKFKEDES